MWLLVGIATSAFASGYLLGWLHRDREADREQAARNAMLAELIRRRDSEYLEAVGLAGRLRQAEHRFWSQWERSAS